MKHDFINDQIWHAAKQAALATDYYRIVPTNYLQAFINALPDPSYPEIALDDVRKGDRVRITTSMGNQYEVTVDRMDSYTWRWNGGSVYIDAIERVYLIERPVKHPDPDKDLVIFDGDGSIWFRSGYGDEYHSPTDFTYFKHPTDFTEWKPAKVVSADE
mgnify:CR=1 FL=1